MDICLHCSKPLSRNAKFCSFCGTAVPTASAVSFRDSLLGNLTKNLKREQLCWLVMGFLHVVGFLYILARIIIMGTAGLGAPRTKEEEEITAAAAMTFLIIVLFVELIQSLVHFFMSWKVSGYVKQMKTNPNVPVARCGTAKTLLWGILFNGIVLISQILSLMLVQNHQIFFDYLGKEKQKKSQIKPTFSEGEELQ